MKSSLHRAHLEVRRCSGLFAFQRRQMCVQVMCNHCCRFSKAVCRLSCGICRERVRHLPHGDMNGAFAPLKACFGIARRVFLLHRRCVMLVSDRCIGGTVASVLPCQKGIKYDKMAYKGRFCVHKRQCTPVGHCFCETSRRIVERKENNYDKQQSDKPEPTGAVEV